MSNKVINLKGGNKFLSGYLKELPSNCLINKGITGCGGTTLELKSNRNSIILCPTKNLVTSKSSLGYFGVDGNVTKTDIKNYITQEQGYKKILATYDALEKLMESVPNYNEYFLLIDEYHLLFNDYSFRSKAIMFILNNFRKFNKWAFMTATPLKEEFILKELKDVDQVTYNWEAATPVNIRIKDTTFIQKELLNLIDFYKDRNLHIFLNSITTIRNIVSKLNIDNYRVVCSETSKTNIKNFAKVTDPIKKLNFYTSCAFEGVDIYDPDGFCIIICDTNIATTVLDISTKIRQVCGRIRDSKFKDQCTLILNTNKHRYANISKLEFSKMVSNSEIMGKRKEFTLGKCDEKDMEIELKLYSPETYSTLYLNKYENRIFYDENLKKLDIYNYNLISEIYNNSISVLGEFKKNSFKGEIQKSNSRGLEWIKLKLIELNKTEFTYTELEEIFSGLFKYHNLIWNKNTSISNFFPEYIKKRKLVNGKRGVYYKFIL